jgi:hypothetical protein
LNQLLTKDLKADEPFLSCGGHTPVTRKFQFCGPLKFADLARIHQIDLAVGTNPDIFLIDCEGLHSLGETTPGLKQATFALAQISSLTILVMRDLLNRENLESVRSLFAISHAFSQQIPGFSQGTVILQRDVGVSCRRSASFDEKNRERRAADIASRGQIRDLLNEKHLGFSAQSLAVLSQPGFDEPGLYWESINDFLEFTQIIASAGHPMGTATLLDLFDEAKPHIMNVRDFDNPSIAFEEIFLKIVCQRLTDAKSHALESLDELIVRPVRGLPRADLLRYRENPVIAAGVLTIQQRFKAKAQEFHPFNPGGAESKVPSRAGHRALALSI